MNRHLIVAAQIINNELFAVKTENYQVFTIDNLILNISLKNQEYYININSKEIDFVIADNGKTILKPSQKELGLVNKF